MAEHSEDYKAGLRRAAAIAHARMREWTDMWERHPDADVGVKAIACGDVCRLIDAEADSLDSAS